MKSKKLLSVALVATMLAAMATSCGNSDKPVDTKTDSKAESTAATKDEKKDDAKSGDKITICFRDDGQREKGTGWKWFANAYEKWDMKDKATLDIAPITAGEGDYFTKIALSLQSNSTAPDIVMEDTFQLPADARANYLTDLTTMVGGWDDWNAETGIITTLKAGVTVEDKVYGVPYNTDTRGLWYNKEILTNSGLDGENWAPKSWEALMADLKTIKEKNPDIVPLWMNSGIATGEATTMQTYQMFLYGTGDAEKTMYKDSKWIVGSQGILDSLTFIETVYKDGLGAPLSKVLDANGSNTGARDYLRNGKCAVELDGNWLTGNYVEGGAAVWPEYAEKLGFTAMPNKAGDGTVTLAGGWALAIPEKSDNKEMSFEFIKQCMSTDIYTDFIVSSGSICTRNDTAKNESYTKAPFMDKATEFLSGAAFRPINDDYPAVSTAVQSMVESVVTAKATPDAAMKQFQTDVVRTVGEDKTIAE